MKLSNLVYVGVGYVLGARAGHDRYEQIVRVSRRVAGSQTVQSTAGVVQAQVEVFTARAWQTVAQKLGGGQQPPARSWDDAARANGAGGAHLR